MEDEIKYILILEACHSYGALYSYIGNRSDLEDELEEAYPEDDVWDEIPAEIVEKYKLEQLTDYLFTIDPSGC